MVNEVLTARPEDDGLETGRDMLIAKTALAATVLFWAGSALAQTSAVCAKMKDPAGCTCAAATGGTVNGRSWARGPDKASFDACLAANGGAPAAGPYRIPARH